MNLAVMFTGGKDSCLALWYALHQGWGVTTLLTVMPENPTSYMFHHPNIRWTTVQAEALGIPHQFIPTKGVKEVEVQDLEDGLSQIVDQQSLDGIVTGGISSDYQKVRFDRVCESLDLHSFTPLWRKDPMALLREEVRLGFVILVTACRARGLDENWLGRRIDENALTALQYLSSEYGVNPAFEGGEAETFVVEGPLFKRRLVIKRSEKEWRGDSGIYRLVDVCLEDE